MTPSLKNASAEEPLRQIFNDESVDSLQPTTAAPPQSHLKSLPNVAGFGPQPSSPSAIHHSQTSVVVSLCHPPLPALRPQPYTIFGRRITRTIQQIIIVFSLRHPPLAFGLPPSNHSNNPTARRHPLSSSSYHLVCLLNYHPPSSSSKRFLPSFSKV
uniref:Uncharacterized protein n=1 Tax=Cucumis melo TaxID=3656 RepID=A0A9I9CFL7_CUCME